MTTIAPRFGPAETAASFANIRSASDSESGDTEASSHQRPKRVCGTPSPGIRAPEIDDPRDPSGFRSPEILAGVLDQLPDSTDWMNLAHSSRVTRDIIGHVAIARRTDWSAAEAAHAFIYGDRAQRPSAIKRAWPMSSISRRSAYFPDVAPEPMRRSWTTIDFRRNGGVDELATSAQLISRILAASSEDALGEIATAAKHLRDGFFSAPGSAQRTVNVRPRETIAREAIIASELPVEAYERALDLVNFTGEPIIASEATALVHCAARFGNSHALDYFAAKASGDPNLSFAYLANDPEPILHTAVRSHDARTLESVLRLPGVDVDDRNDEIEALHGESASAAHVAIHVDNLHALRRLFVANDGELSMDAPAMYTAMYGQPGRLQHILQFPTDFEDDDISCALSELIRRNMMDDFETALAHQKVRSVFFRKRIDGTIIAELLKSKRGDRALRILEDLSIDVNAPAGDERTAIIAALKYEKRRLQAPHYPVLEKMLACGDANLHFADENENALTAAVRSGDPEKVAIILAYRRNPGDAVTNDEAAALQNPANLDVPLLSRLAENGENILHVLATADLTPDDRNRIASQLFTQPGVLDLINLADSGGNRVLHAAVREGDALFVQRLLVDPMTEVSARTTWGETPLHSALRAYSSEMLDGFKQYAEAPPHAEYPLRDNFRECVDALLSDQRLLIRSDAVGKRAELSFAAKHGHAGAVRRMLQAVPPVDVYKAFGARTPFEHAWTIAQTRSHELPQAFAVVQAFLENPALDPNRLTVNSRHPWRALHSLGNIDPAVKKRFGDLLSRNPRLISE